MIPTVLQAKKPSTWLVRGFSVFTKIVAQPLNSENSFIEKYDINMILTIFLRRTIIGSGENLLFDARLPEVLMDGKD